MTSTAYPTCSGNVADERLELLFEELSELAGQRNAIDGRIVEIAAEMERDELCGSTGARSVAALVAWKLGSSSANAHTIIGPAHPLVVADSEGRQLSTGSLARPPTKPSPAVPPYPGPSGERADWWWYEPFQPQPPPSNN